jgi:hypothetical protein
MCTGEEPHRVLRKGSTVAHTRLVQSHRVQTLRVRTQGSSENPQGLPDACSRPPAARPPRAGVVPAPTRLGLVVLHRVQTLGVRTYGSSENP